MLALDNFTYSFGPYQTKRCNKIDPTQYSGLNFVLKHVPVKNVTIQKVFQIEGEIRIEYGDDIYSDLSTAITIFETCHEWEKNQISVICIEQGAKSLQDVSRCRVIGPDGKTIPGGKIGVKKEPSFREKMIGIKVYWYHKMIGYTIVGTILIAAFLLMATALMYIWKFFCQVAGIE